MENITIYWDVLFIVNFAPDFFILLAVIKAQGIRVNSLRLLLASAILGAYGTLYYILSLSRAANFFLNAAVLAAGVLIAVRKKYFIRTAVYFYITAFVFSGCWQFLYNALEDYRMKDLIFLLLAASVASYFLITYFLKVVSGHYKKSGLTEDMIICIDGREAEVKGITDTGNSLCDPITKFPVIVVEYESIKSILPKDLEEFLKPGSDISCPLNRRYMNRIRLIPYSAVGVSSVLKGIIPDYVAFSDRKEEKIKDVVIAMCYNRLSKEGEYSALINCKVEH